MSTLEEFGLTGNLRPQRRDHDPLLYRAYRLLGEKRHPEILKILKSLEANELGDSVETLRARLKEECDKVLGIHGEGTTGFQWFMKQ